MLCNTILHKRFVNYNSAYKSYQSKYFILLSFVMVYIKGVYRSINFDGG